MAFYCIDYINGSDVTGDGTASLPWATIAHSETQINSGTGYLTGDELRIASSPLSAKLAEVNYQSAGSSDVTLNINTDLTGQLALVESLMQPPVVVTWCGK